MVEKNPPQGDPDPERVLDESRDKEFKKTSLDRETANPESTSDTVDVETIKIPLNNLEWTKPPDDLLSGDFSKPSTLDELLSAPVINPDIIDRHFLQLISLCNQIKNRFDDGDRRWQLFSTLVIYSNTTTAAIYLHLHEYKATTVLELCRELYIDEVTVSRIIKSLKHLGLVIEPRGNARVAHRYRPKQKGRRVKIYATPDATGDEINRAMIRWWHLDNPNQQKEQDTVTEEQDTVTVEQVHMEAIETRAEADQVQRYVDAVAPHLEPCHAAPTRENRGIIEAYMKEQGVPEPIWVQVREGVRNVCRRPKGERGR